MGRLNVRDVKEKEMNILSLSERKLKGEEDLSTVKYKVFCAGVNEWVRGGAVLKGKE